MTDYQYIKDLFQAVLSKSKAIEGRFHVSHRYGAQEINSDNLGELISEVTNTKKYPLAMLIPPHSRSIDDWERYRIIIFFAKTSYYGQLDRAKISTHSILEDWHDMKRVSINFAIQLNHLFRVSQGKVFRIPKNQSLTVPFSTIGADRISGIRYDFDLDLFNGCQLEDYTELMTYPENLINDSHAEHQL